MIHRSVELNSLCNHLVLRLKSRSSFWREAKSLCVIYTLCSLLLSELKGAEVSQQIRAVLSFVVQSSTLALNLMFRVDRFRRTWPVFLGFFSALLNWPKIQSFFWQASLTYEQQGYLSVHFRRDFIFPLFA
jgi:hypothetical protein